MLAIFFISMCLFAWSHSAEVHYCYYCSTSLSGVEPLVQRQIMNQRLFYYPTNAIQSRCHGPLLSRLGSVQICSEPMCVSINAQIENINFTVLGCADTILRPSVKLPENTEDHCVKMGMSSTVDFTLCYCSSSLCNVGGQHSQFKTPPGLSGKMVPNVTKIILNEKKLHLSERKFVSKETTKTLSVKKDLSSATTFGQSESSETNTAKSTSRLTTIAQSTSRETTTAQSKSSAITTAQSTSLETTTAKSTSSGTTTAKSTSSGRTTMKMTSSEATTAESTSSGTTTAKSTTAAMSPTTTVMVTSPPKIFDDSLLLETHAEETSGETFYDDDNSTTAPGLVGTASSTVPSRKGTVELDDMETTVVVHQPILNTAPTPYQLDYDPEDREVVELNSEEMERRASVHSAENALYSDLGSPEVYTTPATRPLEPSGTSKSTSTAVPKNDEEVASTLFQLQYETSTPLFTLPLFQTSVTTGDPLSSTAQSIMDRTTKVHDWSTSSTMVPKWSTSSTMVPKFPKVPYILPLDFVEAPIVPSTEKTFNTVPSNTVTVSTRKITTTTPMVLEQGLSSRSGGSIFGTKSSPPLTSMSSSSTASTNPGVFTSTLPSILNTKKIGANSKDGQNITVKGGSKFLLDKENRQIADSPRSHLSDESRESFKSNKELDNFPKNVENPAVMAADKTHSSSGICVILLAFVSVMFHYVILHGK